MAGAMPGGTAAARPYRTQDIAGPDGRVPDRRGAVLSAPSNRLDFLETRLQVAYLVRVDNGAVERQNQS